MKRFLLGFLLLLCGPTVMSMTVPSPSCFVVSGAAGYTMGTTEDGRHSAWWCLRGHGDYEMALLVMKAGYVLIHPTVPVAATPVETALAYWNANVTESCFVTNPDEAVHRLCDAAYSAALATRPLPPFVVRTNGTALTRPTYPVVNGVRSLTSNGVVSVRDARGRPTPCNAAQKLGSYMQVKRTPDLVALCSPS